MGVSTASGYADRSTAGRGQLDPTLFSAKLVPKFYNASVLPMMSNTDYEGEIKGKGSEVVIRTRPTITINDYEKGGKLTYEDPESAEVTLVINKAKYAAFKQDDIDEKQWDIPWMNEWSVDASEQMRNTVDSGILADIYTDAAAANQGATAGTVSSSYNLGVSGTPLALDKTNVIDAIVDAQSVLEEQNIPDNDRFMIIPAWMSGIIKKSELKDASLSGDSTSMLRNGRIGMIDKFPLYMSNNVASTTDGAYTTYYILFGHKSALTFAAQLTKSETLRIPDSFGDWFRTLFVYGYKVIKPESLGVLYVRKA